MPRLIFLGITGPVVPGPGVCFLCAGVSGLQPFHGRFPVVVQAVRWGITSAVTLNNNKG